MSVFLALDGLKVLYVTVASLPLTRTLMSGAALAAVTGVAALLGGAITHVLVPPSPALYSRLENTVLVRLNELFTGSNDGSS